jgi:hypothetical protein
LLGLDSGGGSYIDRIHNLEAQPKCLDVPGYTFYNLGFVQNQGLVPTELDASGAQVRLPRAATHTISYPDGRFTTLYGTRAAEVGARFVLRLVPGQQDAVWAAVENLPFVWLLPAARTNSARSGTATYRVQLQRAPAWLCGAPPCYQGVV